KRQRGFQPRSEADPTRQRNSQIASLVDERGRSFTATEPRADACSPVCLKTKTARRSAPAGCFFNGLGSKFKPLLLASPLAGGGRDGASCRRSNFLWRSPRRPAR